MTNYTKVIGFCLLLFLILPTFSYSQVFRKIQTDGPDLKKDCLKAKDGIFTINIGMITNNTSASRTQESINIVEPPCDLQVGFTIENINTTFYEPIGNITPINNDNLPYNGTISTSFNGDDYGLDCNDQTLTVTMNLYCKDGDEYTPIDVCRDRNNYSSILPLSEVHGCSVEETFELKLCCDDKDISSFRSIGMDNNLKNTNLELEKLGEVISVRGFNEVNNVKIDIFTVTGQKVANTQFYINDDNSIFVESENLNVGCYFIRIENNNQIKTLKFFNL